MDAMRIVLQGMSTSDVINFCATGRDQYAGVCNDTNFWRDRALREYGYDIVSNFQSDLAGYRRYKQFTELFETKDPNILSTDVRLFSNDYFWYKKISSDFNIAPDDVRQIRIPGTNGLPYMVWYRLLEMSSWVHGERGTTSYARYRDAYNMWYGEMKFFFDRYIFMYGARWFAKDRVIQPVASDITIYSAKEDKPFILLSTSDYDTIAAIVKCYPGDWTDVLTNIDIYDSNRLNKRAVFSLVGAAFSSTVDYLRIAPSRLLRMLVDEYGLNQSFVKYIYKRYDIPYRSIAY